MARQHEQEHTEVVRGATGRPVVRGTHGVVASGHYLTSMAGMRMLLSGGNAFDAAVAMGFAAAVIEPTASYSLATEGVGMLYHAASGTMQALSGQGVAPQAATVEAFRARGLTKIPTGPGDQAHLSFTVPGGRRRCRGARSIHRPAGAPSKSRDSWRDGLRRVRERGQGRQGLLEHGQQLMKPVVGLWLTQPNCNACIVCKGLVF